MLRFPAEIIASIRPAYAQRRVVVTGGAGFIGSHLVDALVSLGASVRIIDDLSNASAGYVADLIELEPDRVSFVHGSILDRQALDDAFRQDGWPSEPPPSSRPLLAFHLAAIGSVPLSIEQPSRAWDVNATGTLRVLEALRAAGGGRIVYSSSSSIYGDPPRGPRQQPGQGQGQPGQGQGQLGQGQGQPGQRTEDQPAVQPCHESMPPRPLSPYAASKLAGENLVATWSRCYGLEGVTLRYFNVFGPRQRADSAYAAVIPAFASRMLRGQRPIIYGDGTQTRDFTFVANVVLANLLAGAAGSLPEVALANVAMGRSTSLLQLAEQMAEIVAEHTGIDPSALSPRFEPARHGEIRHSLASIERARGLLGFEPFASLGEGLAETIHWHRAQLEAQASSGSA